MKMTDSLKSIIVATVLLILIGTCWFVLLYRPENIQLQLLKDKTNHVLLQLRSLRVTDAQVFALQQQVERLKDELARKQKRIVVKNQLPVVVNQIKMKGQRFGLKFQNIIPDYNSLVDADSEDEIQADILKLTLHIKLQGYYKSLGKFIAALNDLPYYLSIEELNINYKHAIHPELEVFLDTVVYLKDDKSPQSRQASL